MGLLDRTKSPAVFSTSSSSLLPSGSAPTTTTNTTTTAATITTSTANNCAASTVNCSKQAAATTTNLKISGNKKASYSFYNDNSSSSNKNNNNNNVENIDPKHTNKLTKPITEPVRIVCHDNPVFESEYPSNNNVDQQPIIDTQTTKIVITAINKNQENIHLNQVRNLDLNAIDQTGANNEKFIEQESKLDSVITSNNSPQNGAYAIASSTTLVYITSSPLQKIQAPVPVASEETTTLLTGAAVPASSAKDSISSAKRFKSSLSNSYNTADKLAAAAAAVSSTAADSLVEIPNFGQSLSSMMDHNRVDDEEIAKGKNFDSKINQSHGFTFGEGNSNKKNYTKSANTVSNMMTSQEDDAHQKLTASSSYEIKIRKRRACQLKALVIMVALFAAVCIGCIMAYFFIKYNNEHERYVKYTQYMVAERNSKQNSNKLEVIVPFKSSDNTIDLDAKAELANSIKEAVGKTFSTMNKTVEVIKVYKMSELGNNTYEAVVDVELKNAVEFGVAPLVINTGRITLDESSKLLKTYISLLKNFTLKSTNGFASRLNSIKIEFEKILISFDQKLDAALANQTNQTKPVNGSLFTSITIEQTNNNNKIDIIKNVLSFKTNNSVAGSTTQSTSTFDSTLKNIVEEVTNKKFDQPTQTPAMTSTTVMITSTSTVPTTVSSTTVTSTTITMSTTSVFMFHFKNISRPINTITFRRQTQTSSLPSTSKLVTAKLTSLNTYPIPTVKILPDSTSTSTSTSTETTTITITSSSTTSTLSTTTTATPTTITTTSTTSTTTTSTTTPTTTTETTTTPTTTSETTTSTPSRSTSTTSTDTTVSTTETTESTSTTTDALTTTTTTPTPKTATTTTEFLLTTTIRPSLKPNTIPLYFGDSKQKIATATEQVVSTPETSITLEIEKNNDLQTSSSSLPSITVGTSVPSSTTLEENLFKPKEKDDNITEDMKTTEVAEESLGLKVKNSDILSELRKLDKILSGGRKKSLVLKPNSIFLNKNLNEQEKKPKFGVLTDPIMESLIETSTVKIVYPIIEDIDVPISTTTATTTEKFIQSETTNAFDLTNKVFDLSKSSSEPLYFFNLKTSTPIVSTSKIPEIVKETITLSKDFFPNTVTNKETSTTVSTSTDSTTELTTGTPTEVSTESTKITTTLSITDSTTESTTGSTTDLTTESTTGSTPDSTTEIKTTLESLLFEIPSRENKTQDNLNNESTIKWKYPTESVPISTLQTEKPISLSTTTISIITDLEINKNIESFINSNAFLNDKPSKPTNTNDLDIELQIDDESIIKKILNDSLDINSKNNNQNNNSNPSKST